MLAEAHASDPSPEHRQLRSFFVDLGERGLPVLREAMESLAHFEPMVELPRWRWWHRKPRSSDRWGLHYQTEFVARLMVDIGEPAVPCLVDALSVQDHIRQYAARALTENTGEDFGLDYEPWARWLAAEASEGPEPGEGTE